MRQLAFHLLPLILIGALPSPQSTAAPAHGASAIRYEGAKVWTGQAFRQADLTVVDGRFVRQAPRGAKLRTVDVRGAYIVPAYANAHAHVTNATEETSQAFLESGIFYVWNPNTVVQGDAARAFYARANTYDVKVSQGGITEPGGHPEKLYVDVLSQYVYPGREREWFLGNAFHYGRTPSEISAALDTLVEQRADFVKAYLVHSDEYAKRRDDPSFHGSKGLNPANLPFLVQQATKRGLEVVAHIDTVPDLLTAAKAGVAIAGHLPGYGGGTAPVYRLDRQQAEQVVRSDIGLIPTYSVAAARFAEAAERGTPDPKQTASYALQKHNLSELKRAGGTFLMGTDGRGPIFEEAEHWVELGAFSSLEAARIVFATGKRLFPGRRIGCFQAGCEADFLILAADPTSDIRNLRRITSAIKAGAAVWSRHSADR